MMKEPSARTLTYTPPRPDQHDINDHCSVHVSSRGWAPPPVSAKASLRVTTTCYQLSARLNLRLVESERRRWLQLRSARALTPVRSYSLPSSEACHCCRHCCHVECQAAARRCTPVHALVYVA